MHYEFSVILLNFEAFCHLVFIFHIPTISLFFHYYYFLVYDRLLKKPQPLASKCQLYLHWNKMFLQ